MFKNLLNSHDRISVNEMATAAQIGILDTFILVFNKTAEGDAKLHAETAKNVIYVLNNIKNLDTHVWRILKYRYKDEIKECDELVGT